MIYKKADKLIKNKQNIQLKPHLFSLHNTVKENKLLKYNNEPNIKNNVIGTYL